MKKLILFSALTLCTQYAVAAPNLNCKVYRETMSSKVILMNWNSSTSIDDNHGIQYYKKFNLDYVYGEWRVYNNSSAEGETQDRFSISAKVRSGGSAHVEIPANYPIDVLLEIPDNHISIRCVEQDG